MNDDEGVSVEIQDHVARVCFSKPPHNHLDVSLMRMIAERMEALDADRCCRVFVLCSEGRVFCAGADLDDRSSGIAGDPGIFYVEAMRLFRLRKPIVVAVQGAAVGAGLGIAVAGDFRLATPAARFSANFTRLGIHPGFGLSLTLPRLLGTQHAARLFYTGCRIDGAEALRIGLVDDLVEPDELMPRAVALAREIAVSSPVAVQSIRETMRLGLAEQVIEANRRERELQKQQFLGADFREGAAAARERRAPVFSDD